MMRLPETGEPDARTLRMLMTVTAKVEIAT
jgi:hypothetical protein